MAIPSPNIWHWPELYEIENRAQDADGAVYRTLSGLVDWTDGVVVDLGCGSGFHLPMFAQSASSVIGVEPHPPLVAAARRRTRDVEHVRVSEGTAESVPVEDGVADLVHARTAYFFGPGCGAGIAEAMRVLKPGGVLAVVDLDATAGAYGRWMRRDLPQYDPARVEKFFEAQGFDLVRIDTRWEFPDRDALRAVLAIEFTKRTAAHAFEQTPGVALDVRYRLHTRARPTGLVL
ncbi:class I SAM-dependent methyltransferase [Rhodococcus sp. NPDC058521]|uniref:class I SAM-dependent methyltransferase n=1 Tax=Rhodococcus sp. NPDC058521 TaxID=3346536 RepID=UPI003652DB50